MRRDSNILAKASLSLLQPDISSSERVLLPESPDRGSREHRGREVELRQRPARKRQKLPGPESMS